MPAPRQGWQYGMVWYEITVWYGIFWPLSTVRNYGMIFLSRYGMVRNYVIFNVPFRYLSVPFGTIKTKSVLRPNPADKCLFFYLLQDFLSIRKSSLYFDLFPRHFNLLFPKGQYPDDEGLLLIVGK